MSELGSTAAGLRPFRLVLPAAPISQPRNEALAIALLALGLLSVAVWNGFPIIFYDTGAYMLQGFARFLVAERSPIYSAFIVLTGAAYSLWFVAAMQCVITAFVMTQFARAVRPTLSLWALLALGAALCVGTGLPWYAGQIEPDCFVAIVPLALYLLAFHGPMLGRLRRNLLFACAALAIACHSSHVALAGGLLVALAALRFAPAAWMDRSGLTRPHLALAAASFVVAVGTIFAVNFCLTGQLFFSRSGSIFLEARLMEDGLIAPVLDADCAMKRYAICAYKDRLPSRADTWLWVPSRSPFKKLGGFEKRQAESAVLVRASLLRYPLENALVALQDGLLQFFWFQTGDGIVPQEWVLNHEFRIVIPQQLSAYDRAYQQEGEIWFVPINVVHVPIAILSLAALFMVLRRAWLRRDWRGSVLPAFILLALMGNALVCGAFSGPHGRYQSRIIWLPTFVVALMAWPRIEDEVQRRLRPKATVV
ncbi:MAG: hypothetical protein WDM91_03710 [Rhizomicrobium sp.]